MDVMSFELAYGPEGFDPDAVQTITLTDVFSYTISSLVPDTTLEFRIRTHCDENYFSAWSDPLQVSTLPYQPATLPYSCNFENGEENAFWTISNGNHWILTSDTFFTFNNLTPNAQQVAYVRSYCDGQTSNAASVTFHTDCDGIVSEFPWTEGFEDTWIQSYVLGQQNSSPQCWKIYNGGTTQFSAGSGAFFWKANVNAAQVHSGQRSAVCYTDYALARHNDWLVSPMLNLTGEQHVTFYVQNNTENTSKVDEISVWISDENAVLSAPTSDTAALPGFTQLFQTVIPVGSFHYYEVSLAGFSGHRYIAFVRRNAPNAGWYLCLDDVTVEDAPPCATPDNLSAVPSAYEVQLSWEAESEYYNLYYKKT